MASVELDLAGAVIGIDHDPGRRAIRFELGLGPEKAGETAADITRTVVQNAEARGLDRRGSRRGRGGGRCHGHRRLAGAGRKQQKRQTDKTLHRPLPRRCARHGPVSPPSQTW